MTKEEFKKEKIEGREKLLEKIIEAFKEFEPVAIHQFGSGKEDYRDEFSDLDLWITLPEDQYENYLKKRLEFLGSIEPIFIKQDAKVWEKGGSVEANYTLVIHEIEGEFYHVDYYVAKRSKSKIWIDSKLIYGEDAVPRKDWVMEMEVLEPYNLQTKIENIIFMSLIGVKGVVRGWDNGFEKYLISIYENIEELSGEKLEVLPEKLSFEMLYKIFENIYPLASEKEKIKIDKIREYTEEVQQLYG